ncbi:DUF1214 domain-containing protein [Jeongeupia wiesaeckerbachi]|uniref:DUF1254 domain-containing protein n=1 Tax=Jeongeupia wiesaeckerbachi TaxID=3051218 RepID=UPI003D8062A2
MKRTIISTALLGLALAHAPALAASAAQPTVSASAAQPAASGPVKNTVMTEGYARAVAQMAYVWAWPLVNVQSRRLMYSQVPIKGLLGPTPVAPVNELAMLTDYIDPNIRIVAHPNQDVVYGFGALALDKEPVVIQVPDFGKRFWMYELADQRTDSFAKVAKIYGTKPGFYLIVGPDWKGQKPKGVRAVLRSPTNTGVVIPRVFMEDNDADRKAIQPVLNQIAMYPLSKYTGKLQTVDWHALPKLPVPAAPAGGESTSETKWVTPEKFFAQLKQVLAEVPPLPGEAALYQQFNALLAAADRDPKIAEVLKQTAIDSEKSIVDPMFFLNHVGVAINNHWTRPFNNAAFGTDYLTRLAVAKSNIFTNQFKETTYLYQYMDKDGQRLNGQKRYTLTFAKGQTPPVTGFWSLTMYNKEHFFTPNDIKRYSTGTKNKDLKYNADGSLTIVIQHDRPADAQISNWLPAPEGDFAMTIRAYGPKDQLVSGQWAPPAVIPQQ